MADSPSSLTPFNDDDDDTSKCVPEIPIEIVSDEEMALIEAALAAAAAAAARSSIPAIRLPSRNLFNSRSIHSISHLTKRGFSSSPPDIEDLCQIASSQKKKIKASDSLLRRFRKNRGLAVTDITRMEWCEKQMEFSLLFGEQRKTKAMEAGIARHAMLEAEVVKKVKVQVKSAEDRWALKLINFTFCVNQLLVEGLTRELPVMGMVDDVWIDGVIDELQMLESNTGKTPMLVDTKTRTRDTIPAEPQRRNGKLQLMCYKLLLDNLISGGFSYLQFFDVHSLNPYSTLSEEISNSTTPLGFTAKTLDDVVRCYINCCTMLPLTHNQLKLRYESQKDQSIIVEDEFAYDHEWLKSQLEVAFQVWREHREPKCTPQEERWKCRHCEFSAVCPSNANLNTAKTPE